MRKLQAFLFLSISEGHFPKLAPPQDKRRVHIRTRGVVYLRNCHILHAAFVQFTSGSHVTILTFLAATILKMPPH